ncbi:uncharacterized protein LOC100899354 [Galendromus occidentalis]|uniref:Uncharacterized protein LOC100899354 n=1 Tax=Galendromus occidentalis TaxID=34638 RepID=A0AAJ6VWT6_9ACAR|nr:uncharacterized protein LOC100899354 [Galendromus occidentalis]
MEVIVFATSIVEVLMATEPVQDFASRNAESIISPAAGSSTANDDVSQSSSATVDGGRKPHVRRQGIAVQAVEVAIRELRPSTYEATDADKLVALCKLLKGPPKDIISELPLTDNNYKVAVKLFDENYDVPELRQQDVLASIVTVPKVRHQNDTAALRELLNVAQRTILSLAAISIPLSSISLPYEQTIRRALPVNLLLQFEDSHPSLLAGDEATSNPASDATRHLELLLSFLRRYTALRERIANSDPKQHRPREGEFGGIPSAAPKPPARALPRHRMSYTAAGAARNDRTSTVKKPRNSCMFCSSADQRPSACTAEITIQRRREMLSQRQRCTTCFQFEHRPPRTCNGPRESCQICNSSAHYTSMHGDTAKTDAQRSTAAGVLPTVAAISAPRSIVMTAAAFAVHGNQRIPVRCFMDSGSMVSFATTNLIRSLPDISPQARVELKLQGVASQHVVSTNRYAIRLVSALVDSESVTLQAHEFDFGLDSPTSCSQSMQQLIRKFGEVHTLADSALIDQHRAKAPDLLIGIDQMFKIMHLNREKIIADGLTAKSSRFGWIISGAYGAGATRADVLRVRPTCCAATLSRTEGDIERLWSLDAVGVSDPKAEDHSVADLEALRQFRDGVHWDGKRYTVTSPKRDSIVQLSNNLDVALRRLTDKRRSLARNFDTFKRYDAEIWKFVHADYAEGISDVDLLGGSRCDRTY